MKIKLLFTFTLFAPFLLFAQQSLVTHWDFNSLINDANSATGNDLPVSGVGAFATVGGSTFTYATGYTGTILPVEANTTDNSGYNVTGWPAQGTGNKTRGIQINTNTTGFARIGISFWQRLSNTAPNTWVLQYTPDHTGATTGGTAVWVDTTIFTFVPQATGTGDTWHYRSVSFAANNNFNNKPNLAFRVVAAFDPTAGTYLAARSTSTFSTTGTSRFDLVRVFEAPVDASIAAASNFFAVNENVGTVNVPVTIANANQAPVTVNFGFSTYHNATVNSDFTWTGSLTVPAATNGVFNLPIQITDDLNAEKAERIIVKILNSDNATASLTNNYCIIFIKDNDYVAPTPTNELNLQLLTSFSNGVTGVNSAEIVAFDPSTDRLYIANSIGQKMDVVNFSNPSAPVLLNSISMAPYGGINSIVAKNGIVAAAVENANPQLNGSVVFFDQNGVFQNQVSVGAMPDMITFNQDYTKLLTANEGEPNSSYSSDPEGSVSIIDISGGIATLTQANVTTIGLTSFNGQETALRAQGIRIFTSSATVAQDLEPEYIAVSTDNTKAYVTMQENNALLTIDLLTNSIVSLTPFGYSSYAAGTNNALDASDQSGMVLITGDLPIKGAYMPDAMTYKTIGGQGFLFTANEGDSREFGSVVDANRISSTTFNNLDVTAFPDAAIIRNNKFLGRLSALKYSGDTDGDGDYDELHVMSGRSFSIWNPTTGAQVFDSKDLIEQITANHPTYGALFNASNTVGTPALKNRSDDKGPEVEGIAVHQFNGHTYVFASLERIGGVMIFNIDNPSSPVYVGYANNRSASNPNGPDLGAEGIIVIDAQDSPNGQHLLLLANEVSSTLSIYQMNSCAVASGAVITAASNTVCAGQSVNLNINTQANVTYQWFANNQAVSGATTNSLIATTAGTYKVAVQNSVLGCIDTSGVFTLTVNPLPQVNAGQDVSVCSGSTVNLVATGNATSYIWNNGQTGTTLTLNTTSMSGLSAYTVTATNITTGCQAQDVINLTVNALPIVNVGNDLVVCSGTNVNLLATGNASSYLWNNGTTGAVLTVNTQNLSGVNTFTVTASNLATGCQSQDVVLVTVNPLPQVNAGQDVSVCSGSTVNLVATGNATSYVWNNGQSGTALAINTQGFVGVNTYTVTATNITTGCQAQDAVQVTVNALPQVNAGPDLIICLGDSILLNASGAQTYNWNNNYTNGTYITPGAGLSNLVVSGVNNLGCTANDSLEIQVNALPGISITPGLSVCASNLPVNLEVNTNGAVLWNTNETTNSIAAASSGIYSVIVTDLVTGCQNQASTELQVWQNPTIDLDSVYGVCSANLPYSIDANALGSSLTYLWSNGQTNSSLNGSQQGIITLEVTDVNGCQATAQTEVEILTSPNVNAGQDQVVCEDHFPITIAASGSANSIEWNTGSSAALLSVNSPGIYILTGINNNGCIAQDSVVITSDPCLALQEQEEIFNLFPNPVSDILYVNAPENSQNISILSSEGKLIQEIEVSTTNLLQIDMRMLPAGIYLISMKTESGLHSQRIIKL